MLATALHACGTTVNAATSGASSGGGFGPPFALGPLATSAIAFTILCVALLALALIVVLSRRPKVPMVAVPAGARISPDGYYWWDGTAWRPTR